jgi:hypothetical protein
MSGFIAISAGVNGKACRGTKSIRSWRSGYEGISMTTYDASDSLHRLVKQALDSGEATTLSHAEAIFAGYRISLSIDDRDANDRDHQSALLTAVALSRRVFLGGVTVVGNVDVPLASPLPLGSSLREAIVSLGARCAAEAESAEPTIFFGGSARPKSSGFNMRAVFGGWSGGVVPAHSAVSLKSATAMPLAPMLAAALAVSEAFFFVQGKLNIAGRRSVGISLWNPGSRCWLVEDDNEVFERLPSRLWMIGLGHLGQAYLWALGLLPYEDPSKLSLVLQDTDKITPSTESTSILSDRSNLEILKTRAMAAFSERRGFKTAIVERLFDDAFRRSETDPAVAICGLDNAIGRQAFDTAKFPFVVEAGLGRGFRDFRSIRIHTLPASRSAADIWKTVTAATEAPEAPAYQSLRAAGTLDQCGLTLLAGKAVGAPFVGSVAACLVVAEVLRQINGGQVSQLIDLDLESPDHRLVSLQTNTYEGFNPGFVNIRNVG